MTHGCAHEVYNDYLKERLNKIENAIIDIKNKQLYFHDRFLIIDSKKSMIDYLGKNWWKFTALIVPLLFMLGEIGLAIRKIFPG